MTRMLGFLATIMIVATVGLAAENISLKTRAAEDHTANGRQPAVREVSGQQSFPSSNSIATLTSQTIRASFQAAVVERASLAADGQTGGSEPNSTNQESARRETSAAPDSSASKTTSPQDPAVQNVSEEPATPRGQLPQTSTILPLLGLIGLGSLVAGFFARR